MILVIITIFAMINHGVDDCKESVSALAYRRGGQTIASLSVNT